MVKDLGKTVKNNEVKKNPYKIPGLYFYLIKNCYSQKNTIRSYPFALLEH